MSRMALAAFAKTAVPVAGPGLRCGAPLAARPRAALRSLSVRTYATVTEGLKYSKNHEWVKVDGDTATVGITDYAQEQLGEINHVELHSVGYNVTADADVAVLESVKIAADAMSPVSGKVVEVNSALSDAPTKVNTDPYGSGWLVKVKMSDPAELNRLMDAGAYTSYFTS